MHVWRNYRHLHSKQNEISQKQSEKAKIFQRRYSIILKVLPNRTIKNFEVRGTLRINCSFKAVFHYVRFARGGGAGFESRKCFNPQGELNNARTGKVDIMENSFSGTLNEFLFPLILWIKKKRAKIEVQEVH